MNFDASWVTKQPKLRPTSTCQLQDLIMGYPRAWGTLKAASLSEQLGDRGAGQVGGDPGQGVPGRLLLGAGHGDGILKAGWDWG